MIVLGEGGHRMLRGVSAGTLLSVFATWAVAQTLSNIPSKNRVLHFAKGQFSYDSKGNVFFSPKFNSQNIFPLQKRPMALNLLVHGNFKLQNSPYPRFLLLHKVKKIDYVRRSPHRRHSGNILTPKNEKNLVVSPALSADRLYYGWKKPGHSGFPWKIPEITRGTNLEGGNLGKKIRLCNMNVYNFNINIHPFPSRYNKSLLAKEDMPRIERFRIFQNEPSFYPNEGIVQKFLPSPMNYRSGFLQRKLTKNNLKKQKPFKIPSVFKSKMPPQTLLDINAYIKGLKQQPNLYRIIDMDGEIELFPLEQPNLKTIKEDRLLNKFTEEPTTIHLKYGRISRYRSKTRTTLHLDYNDFETNYTLRSDMTNGFLDASTSWSKDDSPQNKKPKGFAPRPKGPKHFGKHQTPWASVLLFISLVFLCSTVSIMVVMFVYFVCRIVAKTPTHNPLANRIVAKTPTHNPLANPIALREGEELSALAKELELFYLSPAKIAA